MGERRERKRRGSVRDRMEDKGRKRKIGEREGGESGRGTERRDGEHKQTLSL